MDERQSLLDRLAAAGASDTLVRDAAEVPGDLDGLRDLVLSMEASPRRPTLVQRWAIDADLYAQARRPDEADASRTRISKRGLSPS